MTEIEKIEDYICNLCYEEFPITAYPLIDLKESPELLAKILDKSLFEYTCPHCNQKLIVKYDFTCLHVDKTLIASVYWNDWTFAKAKLLRINIYKINELPKWRLFSKVEPAQCSALHRTYFKKYPSILPNSIL